MDVLFAARSLPKGQGPNFRHAKLGNGSFHKKEAVKNSLTYELPQGNQAWIPKNSKGPSTQYLGTLVPTTTPSMAFGTRVLKYWVLGPSREGSAPIWSFSLQPRLWTRPVELCRKFFRDSSRRDAFSGLALLPCDSSLGAQVLELCSSGVRV